MKVTMVIPSYWAREGEVGGKEGDAIYSYPAPLEREGTLFRAINSVTILKDKDFQLAIIVVPTQEFSATRYCVGTRFVSAQIVSGATPDTLLSRRGNFCGTSHPSIDSGW